MTVNQLLPLIEQLARNCQSQAYGWMTRFSPTQESLVADLSDIVDVYCASAAILAADWYNDQDSDSPYFARSSWVFDEDQRTAVAAWVFRGPQLPENQMRLMARSLVYVAARKTIWANAEIEGVAVARHEGADACAACQVRSTNSVIERNSSSEDILRDFHHSCTGMYVPIRTGVYEPPEYARSWAERINQARLAGKVNADDIAKWLEDN